METAGYTAISRQSSLLREMQIIANNIANSNTTGFRQEGLIFSEYLTPGDNINSVSMASGRIHNTSFAQGGLEMTGGTFDLAIEGDGFFLIGAAGGQRLTRNGVFTPNAEGTLVTMDGNPVLDAGGAPVFIPGDASDVAVGRDGTISAGGRPIGQIGVVQPLNIQDMQREGSLLFDATTGFEPVEFPVVMQGFVEASNVDPIMQISRMIDVQRAYELGQSFAEKEDERIRNALKAFVK